MAFSSTPFKILQRRESLLVFIGFLLVAIAIHHRLWLGEIPMGEDSRHHYLWIQNFAHQFSQGDLYPRWLAETNHRYGSPTFVFYPPFTYFVTSILKVAGLPFETLLAVVFTGITLSAAYFGYLAKRRDWGALPAIAIGVFFLFSQYQLVSLYSRGALAESVAMSLIPLGIWLTGTAIEFPRRRLGVALTAMVLAMTHLPSLLLLAIFWIPFIVVTQYRAPREMLLTLVAVFCGWGAASFYLLPAILEKGATSVENLKAVAGGYSANLFWSSEAAPVARSMLGLWRNEARLFGACIVIGGVLCFLGARRRGAWGLLAAAFAAVTFAMSDLSRPIWSAIELLQNVQFPWRLMGLLGAIVALSTGFLLSATTNRIAQFVCLGLLCAFLLLTLRDTKRLISDAPTLEEPRWYLDREEFVTKLEQTRTSVDRPLSGLRQDVPEYRPAKEDGSAYEPRPDAPPVTIDRGTVEIERWKVKTRTVITSSPDAAIVTFRVYDYPAWNLYIDGEAQPIERSPEGTISARVPAGDRRVELKYEWTGAMYLGAALSLASIAVAVVLFLVPNLSASF